MSQRFGGHGIFGLIIDVLGWVPFLGIVSAVGFASLAQTLGFYEFEGWMAQVITLYEGGRDQLSSLVVGDDMESWVVDAAVGGLGLVTIASRAFIGFFTSVFFFILLAGGAYVLLNNMI